MYGASIFVVIVAIVMDMIVEVVMVWLLLFSQVVDVSKQWNTLMAYSLKSFSPNFFEEGGILSNTS